MPLPVAEVQRALADERLDGWLLYDFQGSNPIAARLSGLAAAKKMTTRRWYYLIPANGRAARPRARHRAAQSRRPAGREAARMRGATGSTTACADCCKGMKRVAMEYSPGNNIPYISRVDAGTIESVRDLGVEVVSSGDLVQRFEAVWSAEALATHRTASDALYRIKDQAFAMVRERLAAGAPLTEYDVQQAMMGWFDEEGLIAERHAERVGPGERRQSRTTTRPARSHRADSSRRGAAARPLG